MQKTFDENEKMNRIIYAYRVVDDTGFAPCIDHNLFSLACCKGGQVRGGKDIRTGLRYHVGEHLRVHPQDEVYVMGIYKNRLLYYARVTECMPMTDYFSIEGKQSFGNRKDHIYDAENGVLKRRGPNGRSLFVFRMFQHTEYEGNRLRFCKGQGFHMIFGWLQIEQMCYSCKDTIPDWLQYHAHMREYYRDRPDNCIYIGRKQSSWDEHIAGYGTFSNYHEALVLTKSGETRSKWNLPQELRPFSITYHKESSWKEGYFQSALRGQEFVFEESSVVEDWAKKLINENI